MKYNDFKESLKKKATNLRDIKIGLKEKQRTLHFNSYDREGNHHGYVGHYQKPLFSTEQLRRHELAQKDYNKCVRSHSLAYPDYRARHIAISLFRGKTPEQIENNYYDGKWDFNIYDPKKKIYVSFQVKIDNHLKQLELDNPPREEYDVTEYMKEVKPVYDKISEQFEI